MHDVAVYEAVAAGLAEARTPDLSPFDPLQVHRALERVLGEPGARQDFLRWLSERVTVLSGGRTRLEARAAGGQPGSETPVPRIDIPELVLRLVVAGEPFSEQVVVRTEDPVVDFPMR